MTKDVLAVNGFKHSLDSRFDFLNALINNSVCADVNSLRLRGVECRLVGTDVEADNDSIRSVCKHNVVFSNAADARMNNVDLDLIV